MSDTKYTISGTVARIGPVETRGKYSTRKLVLDIAADGSTAARMATVPAVERAIEAIAHRRDGVYLDPSEADVERVAHRLMTVWMEYQEQLDGGESMLAAMSFDEACALAREAIRLGADAERCGK